MCSGFVLLVGFRFVGLLCWFVLCLGVCGLFACVCLDLVLLYCFACSCLLLLASVYLVYLVLSGGVLIVFDLVCFWYFVGS